MALQHLHARIRLENRLILGRERNALGMNDDANGARLAIRRPSIFADLRDLAGEQVAFIQGTAEFEMQLRKAQRQSFTGRPTRWCGPDDERVGRRVLAQASKTGFDRSSSQAPHVIRFAVEPHPGGQRRANLRRQFNPKRRNRLGEPATGAGPPEPSSTAIGWHGPPVSTHSLGLGTARLAQSHGANGMVNHEYSARYRAGGRKYVRALVAFALSQALVPRSSRARSRSSPSWSESRTRKASGGSFLLDWIPMAGSPRILNPVQAKPASASTLSEGKPVGCSASGNVGTFWPSASRPRTSAARWASTSLSASTKRASVRTSAAVSTSASSSRWSDSSSPPPADSQSSVQTDGRNTVATPEACSGGARSSSAAQAAPSAAAASSASSTFSRWSIGSCRSGSARRRTRSQRSKSALRSSRGSSSRRNRNCAANSPHSSTPASAAAPCLRNSRIRRRRASCSSGSEPWPNPALPPGASVIAGILAQGCDYERTSAVRLLA